MRPFAAPALLTPQARLAEVAGIFAAGLLRLHLRDALSDPAAIPHAPEPPGKSPPASLELSRETRLSGQSG